MLPSPPAPPVVTTGAVLARSAGVPGWNGTEAQVVAAAPLAALAACRIGRGVGG